MSKNPGHKITLVASLSSLCLVLSLLLPRVFQDSEGFSGATSAALLFLALFAVSAALAIYIAVYAVRNMRKLDVRYRIIGIAPCLVVAIVILFFYIKLPY